MHPALSDVLDILIATLGGAAIGLEREWSGHAAGPRARFAGIRTFTLLGLAAGIAGWLVRTGYPALGTVLAAGAAALIVAAYAAASRADVEGTTEVAALVVLAAGVLAGMDHRALASGIVAVTALLLVEKSRLHAMVRRIDDATLRAGIRFGVLAVVILPLLPPGPYGPLGGIRPRQLWALVLFFSGLSFAGYIARRVAGPRRGYPVAGMLGGIISSTNVTLTFARASRAHAADSVPLALGVVAASAVMCIRVLVATAVLNPPVAWQLVSYLAAPFLVAAAIAWRGMRGAPDAGTPAEPPRNPLQLVSALQMAALFQLVLFAVRWAQDVWGQAGVFASAGVLGLTDMDALVISLAHDAAGRLTNDVIAQALLVGVLSNTLLKLVAGVALGTRPFARLAGAGLLAVAVAAAATLFWLR